MTLTLEAARLVKAGVPHMRMRDGQHRCLSYKGLPGCKAHLRPGNPHGNADSRVCTMQRFGLRSKLVWMRQLPLLYVWRGCLCESTAAVQPATKGFVMAQRPVAILGVHRGLVSIITVKQKVSTVRCMHVCASVHVRVVMGNFEAGRVHPKRLMLDQSYH